MGSNAKSILPAVVSTAAVFAAALTAQAAGTGAGSQAMAPIAESLSVRYFAKVYLLPSEDSPLIGIGGDGQRLPVYRHKEGWAQVGFNRATGWVREAAPAAAGQGAAPAMDPASAPGKAAGPALVTRLAPRTALAAALALSAFLASIAALVSWGRARRRKARTASAAQERPSSAFAGRQAVLLAPKQKIIESHLAGIFIPLDQCLRDLGFTVEYASTLAQCAARFKRGVPAILGVDAQAGPRIAAGALDLCRRATGAPGVIFLYNSIDPEDIRPPSDLPQVHYLNGRFSSRHVMELLAPAYHVQPASAREEEIPREPCSLEGAIAGNGLSDILQFLEVGRRSGMLSIEDGAPAGVLNFTGGVITFAQTHGAEGADAVLEILSMARGNFRFFGDKRIHQGNCRLSAFEVALHWAHRHDETVKMAQAAWSPGSAQE